MATRKRKLKQEPAVLDSDSTSTLPALTQLAQESSQTNQRTAQLAASILTSKDPCFVVPTQRQRMALLVAHARAEHVVYGKAFDIVRRPPGVDLDDADSVFEHLEHLVLCEIKSTNRRSVKPDFRGYFFAITAAEMLVAQSLGERYRFLFVNTITGNYLELTLQQIFGRARGIYPTWSVSI